MLVWAIQFDPSRPPASASHIPPSIHDQWYAAIVAALHVLIFRSPIIIFPIQNPREKMQDPRTESISNPTRIQALSGTIATVRTMVHFPRLFTLATLLFFSRWKKKRWKEDLFLGGGLSCINRESQADLSQMSTTTWQAKIIPLNTVIFRFRFRFMLAAANLLLFILVILLFHFRNWQWA